MKQPKKKNIKPLLVNTKLDPNYQAYSDSLGLYNASQYIRKNLVGVDLKDDKPVTRTWKYDPADYEFEEKTWSDIENDPKDELYRDSKLYKEVSDKYLRPMSDRARMTKLSSTDPVHKTIQPTSYYNEQSSDKYGTFNFENPIYKAPERPVYVKGTPEYKQEMAKRDPDYKYNKFKNSLPENLRNTDESTYNLRGYWDALGSPEKFDTSQAKQEDGKYHAFSRHPKTGEILKKPNHPTFKQAIEEGKKAGYQAYEKNGKVYTFKEKPDKSYTPYEVKRDDGIQRVSWGSGKEIDRAMGWYRDPVTRKLIPTPKIKN